MPPSALDVQLAAQLPLAQQPGGDLSGMVFPLILMFAFIYFFIIKPQKKEQAEKDALLAALKKNDKVVTSAGIHGVVINIKDDEVTLRVDDKAKVHLRFVKSAIVKVLGQSTEPAEDQKS